MNIRVAFAVAFLMAVPIGALAASLTQTLQPNDTLSVTAQQCDLSVTSQSKTGVSVACGPQWTPTPLPATPTSVAATSTPVGGSPGQPCPTSLHPTTGWHAPVHSSGCYFQHEHGDQPPSWVASAFTQNRESHVGYKGTTASMSNGVQSYFIAHILTTASARSHGDHDFQLWIKDPSNGISFWQGVMDFGSPPPLRTADDSQRPIVLSQGDGGCETWYSRPGTAIMDVGWVVCGRYDSFAGQILGGIGTTRRGDWVIPHGRLSNPNFPGAAPTLAQYALTEYGVQRFTFLQDTKNFPNTGVVPIN